MDARCARVAGCTQAPRGCTQRPRFGVLRFAVVFQCKIVDPTGTPVYHAYPESQVAGDLGGTSSSLEGVAYDATNTRLVFANGFADNTSEGVVAINQTSVPVELSVFSAD